MEISAVADTAEEVLGLCAVAVIGHGDQTAKVEELLERVGAIGRWKVTTLQ